MSKTLYELERSTATLYYLSQNGLLRSLVYTLLLISAFSGRLRAQQNFLFTRLGLRDGLVSNTVLSLQQDAKGYIWVGTTDGLQRYDGNRFVTIRHRPNDPASLPNNVILQLILDHSNRLWVRCAYNRMGYIDLADLRYHPAPAVIAEEELNKRVGKSFLDRDGHIYLVLVNKAILMYDEKMHLFISGNTPFQAPEGWSPTMIYQDSLSNYWLGSDSGLIKYNPVHQTLSYRGHNTDNDPVISHFAEYTSLYFPFLDQSGRFWVVYWPRTGVGASYFSYDLHSGKGYNWNASVAKTLRGRYNEIKCITEQSDHTIWLAGVNMLLVARPGSGSFELIKPNSSGEFSLHYDVVQDWIEDREHNIWLATDRGLYWFNPGAQLFHSVSNRLPGRDSIYTGEVTTIRQLKNGDIVTSSWGDGIFAYDSNFQPVNRWYINEVKQYRDLEHQAWCVLQRSNGDIWTGHQHGILFISHWDRRKTEMLNLPVFHHSTIRQMITDLSDNIWLGQHNGDLIRWQARTNTFTVMTALKSAVQRLYVDRRGDIWACTEAEGLFRVRASDGMVLNHYSPTDPEGKKLSGTSVTDIIQYSDSLYLIATHNLDILNINTGLIRSDTTISGALFNRATNLMMDHRGYVWITNSEGLHRLNFSKQMATTFYEMDGVGSNAFNLGSAGELKDGRIAIGTAHDLLFFQPSTIHYSEKPPNDVEITEIWVQNKPLPVDSIQKLPALVLPYSENALRISLSTLAYQDIGGIMYKLEGIDKDWIDAKSNDAVYSYLPPGHYKFFVTGVNAENMLSRHTTELNVIVNGPFWRSWWFLCFMLLAATAILYLLDRLRTQRRAELENMRNDISGNLHQEVNAALQNINVLSEIARIKADKAPEQSVNYINEIHHKSHHMIIAMDDMLWTIDPANDNMSRVIDRMKEFAEALCHRHEVRINILTEKGLKGLRPDMKIRHELLLIYKLLLRLLVEETGSRDTRVQLDREGGLLQLAVYSAGVYNTARSSRAIRLLEEAKTRAASIRGTLDLQSDDKGTAILFICPSTF